MYKLIAHRGDKTNAKENTIASFKSAIKNAKYCGFECDIRQTKDNKFVINHNALYNGFLISKTNYENIKELPLLEDVLMLATDKIIVLDIKDYFIDITSLIKIINNSKLNLYIISFYDNVINKLNVKNRHYKLGVLNYFLNTNKKHFNYDFLCVMNSLFNKKIQNEYILKGKKLFIYNIKNKDIKLEYPYYITD